ncbi:hypothetical protein [Sphingomonas faeni]|uniref:hypothetical protein n=1 Tax=Sphingomonas faeni TaxID=185950 RepID=UPI00142D4416|nr:hypothetical protein [Sphingomonas faeni]
MAKPTVAKIAQMMMTGLIITIAAPHHAKKLGGAGGVNAMKSVIGSTGNNSKTT